MEFMIKLREMILESRRERSCGTHSAEMVVKARRQNITKEVCAYNKKKSKD